MFNSKKYVLLVAILLFMAISLLFQAFISPVFKSQDRATTFDCSKTNNGDISVFHDDYKNCTPRDCATSNSKTAQPSDDVPACPPPPQLPPSPMVVMSEPEIAAMNTQFNQLSSIVHELSSSTMPNRNAQRCLKYSCSSDPEKCSSKAQGHTKPECCTHHLQRLLVAFDSLFKAHRLEYFLTTGTLLGAVRGQGHIPWTADVDVVPTTSSFVRLLTLKGGINEAAKKHGLHFFFHGGIIRGCLLDPGDYSKNSPAFNLGVPYIDMYSYPTSIASKKELAKSYKPSNIVLSDPELTAEESPVLGMRTRGVSSACFLQALPVQHDAVTMHGSKFPAPQNIEKFLIGLYGDDYMTPDERRSRHGYRRKEKKH